MRFPNLYLSVVVYRTNSFHSKCFPFSSFFINVSLSNYNFNKPLIIYLIIRLNKETFNCFLIEEM